MRILRTLLLGQLLAAILLAAFSVIILVKFTQQQMAANQKNAHVVIEQILNHHLTGDGKIISRQLERSFSLNHLRISQTDGVVLHEQSQTINRPVLADTLLALFGTEFKRQTVKNDEQNIIVSYELNQASLLKQFQQASLLFIFMPLIIGWLPALIGTGGISRSYRRATTAINQLIDNFTDNTQTTDADWSKIPLELVKIKEGLKKLESHTQSQFQSMTLKAEDIAEQAYKDSVTGLPNRNRFLQFFEENIFKSKDNEFGIFAITRCTELQTLNQSRGYQEGDNYIREVAEILKKQMGSYIDHKIYRLNSSDFALLLPRITPKEAEKFALQLQSRFNEFQKLADLDSVAYTGIVSYESGKELGDLLAIADTSISLAQTKQSNAWHFQKDIIGLELNRSNGYGNQNWRNVIDEVLTNNRISLLAQLIQPANRSSRTYSEILVRFKTQEDQILPTASFLAMAEKLDKIIEIDRLIIETALSEIKQKNLHDQYFGINLSARSVHDDQFSIWLERRLLKDANIASKLVFEVTEFGMQQNFKTSKRFIDMVHRAGARITVERFGVGITSFKFFRDLKPDYVKMDGSYTRRINEDKNNQYFMRLMIDLAHRIGVGVFAENVETQEEKHMLESLFIDGNQGYYIGKPTPL
ncbi:EAL domain-containing protein [Rheinheimera sp. WS51]|uniref:EAL domain-containing protein n=1 Tax=Rheinheimera sp. WS51 TaxID=3425886 RepID=UPI003D9087B1